MTTWGDAHARAAVVASQLHADLGVDLETPIDVFGAVQRLGVVLAFSDLGSTSGLYLPPSAEQRLPGILLNSQHPRSRQRYTAGHELGHHAFRHRVEVDGDLEDHLELAVQRGTLEGWPDQEKEAEAFGAWFLMPRRLLRAGLARQGLKAPRHPLDVYALSLWLGTSYTATARHLGTTRLVDASTANRWAALPPKELKVTLSEGLRMTSYRSDVWWLDQHAHGQPVDLRPGDRVLLNLPEDVSTGYTWQIAALPDPITLVADSFVDDWEPRFTSTWAPDRLSRIDRGLEPIIGGTTPRAFVLDVTSYADPGIYHLLLKYGRDWDDTAIDTFELLIAVVAPLHGVQLSEEQLAVSA
jgi:Zn-dependent peptidase ImmA (M78 family)